MGGSRAVMGSSIVKTTFRKAQEAAGSAWPSDTSDRDRAHACDQATASVPASLGISDCQQIRARGRGRAVWKRATSLAADAPSGRGRGLAEKPGTWVPAAVTQAGSRIGGWLAAWGKTWFSEIGSRFAPPRSSPGLVMHRCGKKAGPYLSRMTANRGEELHGSERGSDLGV